MRGRDGGGRGNTEEAGRGGGTEEEEETQRRQAAGEPVVRGQFAQEIFLINRFAVGVLSPL